MDLPILNFADVSSQLSHVICFRNDTCYYSSDWIFISVIWTTSSWFSSSLSSSASFAFSLSMRTKVAAVTGCNNVWWRVLHWRHVNLELHLSVSCEKDSFRIEAIIRCVCVTFSDHCLTDQCLDTSFEMSPLELMWLQTSFFADIL